MKIQFLSVCSWHPEREEEDTVSLLVNDHILVDTGWSCVRNLLRVGKTPEDVDTILFSHMHQDHYISLPSFLFYLLNDLHDASGVEVLGPTRVEEVVEQSLALAGKDLHYADCLPPRYRCVQPGETLELEDLRIETCSSNHAAPGLCYKFIDKKSGGICVYTGDTAPDPAITAFAKGCDVLIHEQSRAVRKYPGQTNPAMHSTVEDAAQCAKAAGAKKLYMVHAPSDNRDESIMVAKEIFENSIRPVDKEYFEL